MIKGSIYKENIKIIHKYEPNRALKCLKLKLTELGRNTQFTIMVGDFNNLLSIMNKTTRQKTNKKHKN